MRKILSFFLAMVLALSLVACGTNNNPAKNVEFDGKDEILKAWSEYLKVNEKELSSIRWGVTYIKTLCEKPDAANYRRALAAAEAVGATIKNIEVPDLKISDEAFAAAVKSGVDLSFIKTEFSGLETSLYSDAELWENLSRDISTESFWSYGTEYLENTADIQLRQAQVNSNNLRYTTNYILLMLGESSFIPDICKDCPTVFGQDNSFIKTTAEVEEKMSASLDELEECISDYAKIESIQNANLSVITKAVSTHDYSEVYSAALPWGKETDVIPMPNWSALPVFYSYTTDSSDEIHWTTVGDDLTNIPSLYVTFDKTAKEDFVSYVEMLNSVGYELISGSGSYDGAEPMNLVFKKGNTEFSVDWDDNAATILIIDADVAVCPLWYFIYLHNK